MTDQQNETAVAVQAPVDIFSEFAIDESKASEGVWVPYKGGVKFLIGRSGNKKFRRMASAQMTKNKRTLDMKDGSGVATDEADDRMSSIMIDVMANSVLLGWTGPLVYEGKPLEYSVANAKRLLKHETFRSLISDMASEEAHFKVVQDAEQEKN